MKSVGFLMGVMCAVALLCLAQDDSESATKSKIVALEQAWNQAYKSADSKALDSILDNAIVLVNDDGSVQSKADFLASVKTPTPSGAQEQQVSPESLSVRVFGETAIATGVMRVKGIEAGKAYSRRERFVDTWIHRNGRWVCVATDATPVLH